MDRLKLLTVAVIVLAILNVFTIGFVIMGKKGHGMCKKDHHRKHDRSPVTMMTKKIGLNPEQEGQLKVLFENHRNELKTSTITLKELKASLFELLKSDSLNTEEQDLILSKIAEKEKEKELIMFNHLIQVKKICTPEQHEKFYQFLEKIKERHHKEFRRQ